VEKNINWGGREGGGKKNWLSFYLCKKGRDVNLMWGEQELQWPTGGGGKKGNSFSFIKKTPGPHPTTVVKKRGRKPFSFVKEGGGGEGAYGLHPHKKGERKVKN